MASQPLLRQGRITVKRMLLEEPETERIAMLRALVCVRPDVTRLVVDVQGAQVVVALEDRLQEVVAVVTLADRVAHIIAEAAALAVAIHHVVDVDLLALLDAVLLVPEDALQLLLEQGAVVAKLDVRLVAILDVLVLAHHALHVKAAVRAEHHAHRVAALLVQLDVKDAVARAITDAPDRANRLAVHLAEIPQHK